MILSIVKPIQPIILFIIANLTVIPISAFYLRESLFKTIVEYEQQLLLKDLNGLELRLLYGKTFDEIKELSNSVKVLSFTSNSRVTIIDPRGQVLLDSHMDPTTLDNHVDRPEVFEAIAGRTGVSQRYSKTLRQHMIYAAKGVLLEDGKTVIVRLGKTFMSKDEVYEKNIGYALRAGALIAIINITLLLFIVYLYRSSTFELINSVLKSIKSRSLIHPALVEDIKYKIVVSEINRFSDYVSALERRIEDNNRLLSAFHKTQMTSIIVTNHSYHILTYNEGTKVLLGDRSDKLLGKNFLDIFRSPKISELCNFAINSRQSVNDIVELNLQDGAYTFRIAINPVVNNSTEIVGILIELMDQRELKALKELEEEFLTNASHELRTPLASIKGYVETLKDGGIDDKEQTQRFLGILAEQVQRLEKIINSILALSQLKHKQELKVGELDEVNIMGLVVEVRELLRDTWARKAITIDVEGDHSITHRLKPDLISHALMNLLENAIKFSPEGSTVSVKFKKENGLLIWVTDQGPGIKPEEREKIFNRFYKGTNIKQKGSGLGLALVKAVIELHRGKVWVEPQEIGSKFVLFLPEM